MTHEFTDEQIEAVCHELDGGPPGTEYRLSTRTAARLILQARAERDELQKKFYEALRKLGDPNRTVCEHGKDQWTYCTPCEAPHIDEICSRLIDERDAALKERDEWKEDRDRWVEAFDAEEKRLIAIRTERDAALARVRELKLGQAFYKDVCVLEDENAELRKRSAALEDADD